MEILVELAFWAIWGIVEAYTGRRKELRAGLDAAAARLGGRVEKRWFERPCVRFSVDGVSATFRHGEARDPGGAQADILFDWKPPHTLRIAPERAFDRVKKWFGSQDVQVDDPEFDPRFLITGSSEDWVRAVLDPATRDAVREVARFSEDFHIDAGPNGVAVHIARNLVIDPFALEDFARAAREVVRGLRDAGSGVAPLLPPADAPVGRCPVCAHDVGGDVRRCIRCRTDHHAECWDYFGRCGVYACGSVHGRTRRLKEKGAGS